MKKTVKINLSGSIFHIDEDAYERLNDYLDKIHEHFKGQEGGEEIIADIEMRMAELFQDKLEGHKQVISDEDVEEVTGRMGAPSDFIEGEENTRSAAGETRAKKLYRDPDQAILGGVASGIGEYLNVDPVWIRLLFVVLMLAYGFIAVIYLLLWLFIPRASTYEQKLEMRGENVTISNIEHKVRDEYEQVKGNFRKYRHSEPYKNITRGLNEIFMVLGRILKEVARIAVIFIGVALIIGGISIILGLAGIPMLAWPFDFYDVIGHKLPDLWLIIQSILTPAATVALGISLALLAVVPLLLLFYAGLKLLTGFRARDQSILLTSLFLWVAALLTAAGITVWHIHDFAVRSGTTEEQVLDVDRADALAIQMQDPPQRIYKAQLGALNNDKAKIQGTDTHGNLYIAPEIDVLKSPDEYFRLKVHRSARGASSLSAGRSAEKINYRWELKDSVLLLDNAFKIQTHSPFRMQTMNLELLVPKGKRIFLPGEAEAYLDEADNLQNMWTFEMGNKVWEMTEDGLRLYRKLN